MNSSFLFRSTLVLGAAVALLGAGCGANTVSSPVIPPPTPPAPVTTTTPETPTPTPIEPATTTTALTPAPATSTSTTPTTPSREPAPAAKTYSLQDVAMHKDASSCWTVIEGKVYDLSAWIARHPGGERAILSLCGKDGTTMFSGQHGGQAAPMSALASFQIGTVK